MRYDVYIAYHPSDKRLARALKRAFERFARPWNRTRALNVWGTSFANSLFGNGLFGNLLPGRDRQGRADEALAGCGRFVLLASSEAAKSERIATDLGRWLESHPIEDLILVLTEGGIAWDPAADDFDWARTPSLPEGLKGKFKKRPPVVDLGFARAERRLLPGHTRFRGAILDVLAGLYGRSPDAIEADDLRRQRRVRLLGAGLLALLGVGSASALFPRPAGRSRPSKRTIPSPLWPSAPTAMSSRRRAATPASMRSRAHARSGGSPTRMRPSRSPSASTGRPS